MAELYGFLWHIDYEKTMASNGAKGHFCEVAKAERETKREALRVLKKWLKERQQCCKIPGCRHGVPVIVGTIDIKIIQAGMKAKKIEL